MPHTLLSHDRARHHVLLAAVLLALWYLAALPSDVPAWQVVVLAGPGAVLGLATGWAAYALHRDRFGWRTGLASALVGAAVLPPVVGSLVMLSSAVFPTTVLTLFVYGAWLALGLGAAAAVVDRALDAARRRRARPAAAPRGAR